MSIVDQAVVWNKRSVDPWNRLTCCKEPLLTVIEFCQVQGPRPLYSYPASGGPHLDLDSVAIWLMSSEAIHGSSIIVYNQQMGIYACVHHSILFDLHARAFQRPISVALLTSVKPTTVIFKEFIDVTRRLLSPLLICNQILFKTHLVRLVDSTGAMENNLSEEKNLLASMSKSAVTKIQSTARQAVRMLQRFQNSSLQSAMSNLSCCKGHQPVGDTIQFLSELGDNQPPSLQDVQFLAPCTYSEFIRSLPEAYEKILGPARIHKSGTLFCAETPVLKLKDRDNHCLDDRGVSSVNLLDENDYLRNLTTIAENLDKILFALSSGEKLALWSPDERRSLGKDLLKKLNLLRVCMQRQDALWIGQFESVEEGCQLFGQSVPPETSVVDSAEDGLCVYDVDGRWIKVKNYNGKALNNLKSKRSDSFPTDYALMRYIVAQLTHFCSIVYLAKCIDLERLRKRLEMVEDDFKMLVNLLAEIDILKYGPIKEKMKKEENAAMIVVKV